MEPTEVSLYPQLRILYSLVAVCWSPVFPNAPSPAVRIAVFVGTLPLVILGFRGGAPPGFTGAPNEQSCFTLGCHRTADATLIEDSQSISINFSGGADYQPGVRQRLILSIDDPMGVVFGFQTTARDGTDAAAGEFISTDASTRVEAANAAQYVGNNLIPREDGMFLFDWVPPAADVGAITFYVAAAAANGDRSRFGDRTHIREITIKPAAPPPVPAIGAGGVVHGATLTAAPGFSPNTFGSVFGTDLAVTRETWDASFVDGVAPTSLGGTQVLVNGRSAFISFIDDGDLSGRGFDQVNFVWPDDEARGPVTVEVITPGGRSPAVMVTLQDSAPGFFPFDPQGRRFAAAIQNDGSSFVAPADLFGGVDVGRPVRPAMAGDIVAFFLTGGGATVPAVPAGQLPLPGTIARITAAVRVFLGPTEAEVLFAGLSAFAGVYQIVVRVPNVDAGEHELVTEIGGRRSPGGLFVPVM